MKKPQQQATDNIEQTTHNKEQTTHSIEQATKNKQETTNNKEPTKEQRYEHDETFRTGLEEDTYSGVAGYHW